MYEENFEKVLNYLFPTEGGYGNHKNDYGGPTNLGVTQTTFNAWRKMNNKPVDDIRNITKDEARKIYHEMYWKASGANKQKDIRDALMLFDTAVQYGDVTARRMFKKAGGDFYKMLNIRREQYKDTVRHNPDQEVFIKGWLNRIDDLEKTGERLFKEENYSTPYNRQITPNFDKTLKGYMNADKINDDDYIKNKIFYYMQKNQDAQNSFDPNYNANVNDITFADEDISKMTSSEFSEVEHIINNQLENNRFLTKNEGQNQVQQGKLIWVDEYVKEDGTKVKGHYRARA